MLLVTGAKVGRRKIEAAEKHGAEVVPWEALWNGDVVVEVARSTELVVDDAEYERLGQPGVVAELTAEPFPRGNGADLTKQEESWVGAAAAIAKWTEPKPRPMYGPMLAKIGDVPTGDGWLHEVKWDGYRCLAYVDDGAVQMISRSAKTNYVEEFPAVAETLARWPNVVLDGELVVLDDQAAGMTNARKNGASFVVFDVLEAFGHDVRRLPLEDRRKILTDVLGDVFEEKGDGRIIVSPVFDDGQALLAEVTERGWEGIVSKPKTSWYQDGVRGWIKVKLRCQQEFVVLGWKPGNGSLEGKLGGLALGVRENGGWTYVGRAGSGPDEAGREQLEKLIWPLSSQPTPPADVDLGKTSLAEVATVIWVEPEVVVEIAFQRWSADGRLTIPSIKGVRFDKDALDVGRQP
jgi:bifunctional non-homologous end joining protein LigD